MGISDKLMKELTGWGALILVVVILSIVLVQFKDVTGNTAEINTTIDTAVTGLQEPANWTDIVVIVIIAVGILGLILGSIYLMRKGSKKGY